MIQSKTAMVAILIGLILAQPICVVKALSRQNEPTETTVSETTTTEETAPSETTEETTESTTDGTNNDTFGTENNDEFQIVLEVVPEVKKTVYNMTTKEMNALSIKQKAKLVGISVKEFNMMSEVISHEAGQKMKDKICVAAVIWNRKYCKQFRNSIKGVINEPGQFYNLSKDKSGNHKDKKAQLAILLAYKQIHQGKIPHDLLYFNSISYYTKNKKRYKGYKHYNNYFLRDTYCHCKWCK